MGYAYSTAWDEQTADAGDMCIRGDTFHIQDASPVSIHRLYEGIIKDEKLLCTPGTLKRTCE
jgi:hypothetical protein